MLLEAEPPKARPAGSTSFLLSLELQQISLAPMLTTWQGKLAWLQHGFTASTSPRCSVCSRCISTTC